MNSGPMPPRATPCLLGFDRHDAEQVVAELVRLHLREALVPLVNDFLRRTARLRPDLLGENVEDRLQVSELPPALAIRPLEAGLGVAPIATVDTAC